MVAAFAKSGINNTKSGIQRVGFALHVDQRVWHLKIKGPTEPTLHKKKITKKQINQEVSFMPVFPKFIEEIMARDLDKLCPHS